MNKKGKTGFVANKKAQMKIQQMAFMLMAVTLFFILVGMFVLVFSLSGLKESAIKLEEENAMLLVSKLANSPEFSCGEVYGTGKTNCIDLDKVMAIKSISGTYGSFWKDISNIEIRTIYPTKKEEVCTQGNYPNCNLIKIHDKELQGNYKWTFVSLCRKEKTKRGYRDKCEIGKLLVSYDKNE